MRLDHLFLLTELELGWLPGYEASAPVRTGNAAYQQFQLDIFGEIANTLFQCRQAGLGAEEGGEVVADTTQLPSIDAVNL